MKDFIQRITSFKSTFISVITGILTVAVGMKLVDAGVLTDGISATSSAYDALALLLGSVFTLVQLFKKDKPED
jgi:hypothetical protein